MRKHLFFPSDSSLLMVEQTCKDLRIVALSRPVWFIQVALLGPSCRPNLPPDAELKYYNAEQLRHIAIEAIRTRDLWIGGPYPFLSRKQVIRDVEMPRYHRVRPSFSPDGRFLFALDSAQIRLEAFDLQNEGRSVWTHDIQNDTLFQATERVRGATAFSVGINEDGSLVLGYAATLESGPFSQPAETRIKYVLHLHVQFAGV